MTVDSMSQVVGSIQLIYTIITGLAIAEAFKQAVQENRPNQEKHARTFKGWFECVYPSRFISMIIFLVLAIPFFQGNQRYLYAQYLAPLHRPIPPHAISSFWLTFDGLVFTLEAGMFFVMSRSLSARRWQQFYGVIVILMLLDFIWAVTEKGHGTDVPDAWLWFDGLAVVILSAIIAIDGLFVPYKKDQELNLYSFLTVSVVAFIGLVYGYVYQLDYLIDPTS